MREVKEQFWELLDKKAHSTYFYPYGARAFLFASKEEDGTKNRMCVEYWQNPKLESYQKWLSTSAYWLDSGLVTRSREFPKIDLWSGSHQVQINMKDIRTYQNMVWTFWTHSPLFWRLRCSLAQDWYDQQLDDLVMIHIMTFCYFSKNNLSMLNIIIIQKCFWNKDQKIVLQTLQIALMSKNIIFKLDFDSTFVVKAHTIVNVIPKRFCDWSDLYLKTRSKMGYNNLWEQETKISRTFIFSSWMRAI